MASSFNLLFFLLADDQNKLSKTKFSPRKYVCTWKRVFYCFRFKPLIGRNDCLKLLWFKKEVFSMNEYVRCFLQILFVRSFWTFFFLFSFWHLSNFWGWMNPYSKECMKQLSLAFWSSEFSRSPIRGLFICINVPLMFSLHFYNWCEYLCKYASKLQV